MVPMTLEHTHKKSSQEVPVMPQAMRKGTDKDWEQRAGGMTFPEAVSKAGHIPKVIMNGWGFLSSPNGRVFHWFYHMNIYIYIYMIL